uniref:Pherophorin domain-containing protein n=1 Tax=Compsopogon caeruleus TaxID=31354 RepID=A0A7S1TI20_9RHOD|mmetsp:Transcript_8062/g.16237  ORF Transcript_8062/g.16237 Transcript_8062/m.16237 type:complete len:145 (+) Transcript_8062:172-606(+)
MRKVIALVLCALFLATNAHFCHRGKWNITNADDKLEVRYEYNGTSTSSIPTVGTWVAIKFRPRNLLNVLSTTGSIMPRIINSKKLNFTVTAANQTQFGVVIEKLNTKANCVKFMKYLDFVFSDGSITDCAPEQCIDPPFVPCCI